MTVNHIQAATHKVQSQDGATISYLTRGNGPSILIIPGALSIATDYTFFAYALAEHFTVHTIERRGRGLSSAQGSDYSMVKECEDIFAVQQETGVSMLVGHSFGGLIALEFVRNNPSITHVAVYEPGVSIDGSVSMDWVPGYEKRLAKGDNTGAFVEFVKGMGPESLRKMPFWLMKLLLPLFIPSDEHKRKLSLLQENLREHKEIACFNNTYENYREITAAVLLMHGGKDDIIDGDRTTERLSTVLSRLEKKKFPELDHFGIDKTSPEEVAMVVREFFQKKQILLSTDSTSQLSS